MKRIGHFGGRGRLAFVFLALALFLVPVFAAPCTDVASWWSFNTTLADKCGTNGLTANDATNYQPFAFANGVLADGVNDAWLNNTLTNMPASNRTTCLWFNIAGMCPNVGTVDCKMYNERGAAKNGVDFSLNNAAVDIAQIRHEDVAGDRAEVTVGVDVGVTYHYCAVWFSANSTLQLYVNGTFNASANNSLVGALDTNNSVFVGTNSLLNRWFNGYIDEIAVFDRVLTPAEITSLFNTNSIGGAATVIDFTPIYAAVNVPTVYTPSAVGNGSAATGWWWYFNNNGTLDSTAESPTHTYISTGQHQVHLIGEFAGANVTRTRNVTVHNAPVANYTITTVPPYFVNDVLQFNDTSTDPDGHNITNWYWTFSVGASSVLQNPTHTFTYPGVHWASLIVTDQLGANSTAYNTTFTINGFMLDVYDEKSFAAIANWSMTVQNSTYSRTFSNQSNTFTWANFSDFPKGPITISLSADGYVGRKYYRAYNIGSYVNMNGLLLKTTDGIYSYFIVQDALGNVLPDVLLTFQFLNGSSWVTAGEALTDGTGSATMWLDWTKSYTLTASKTGYSPVSKTFTPQPITYYIVMGSASVFEFDSLNNSMWASLLPTNPEVNVTTDSIIMAVFDPASGISICGLNLTFTNGTVFATVNKTTEQTLCTAKIVLAGSGIGNAAKFYAVPWFTANKTGPYSWSRLYSASGSDGSSVTNAIEGLRASWGAEALLMVAIFVTLACGAATAFLLGSGSTLVMMAVSGLFFYYGFFGPYAALWFIAVVAGLAALYIERRRY